MTIITTVNQGVTLQTLAEGAAAMQTRTRIIRVMPNTPCMVGMSASAFALGMHHLPHLPLSLYAPFIREGQLQVVK